jgi:hypothetical protein
MQVISFQGEFGNKKFCPVGNLLPGVHVVIFDDEMQPQPVGVAGEVSINYHYHIFFCIGNTFMVPNSP